MTDDLIYQAYRRLVKKGTKNFLLAAALTCFSVQLGQSWLSWGLCILTGFTGGVLARLLLYERMFCGTDKDGSDD